jgi:hypothetical protein
MMCVPENDHECVTCTYCRQIVLLVMLRTVNSNNNKQEEPISKSDASHMTDHLHQGYALTQGT